MVDELDEDVLVLVLVNGLVLVLELVLLLVVVLVAALSQLSTHTHTHTLARHARGTRARARRRRPPFLHLVSTTAHAASRDARIWRSRTGAGPGARAQWAASCQRPGMRGKECGYSARAGAACWRPDEREKCGTGASRSDASPFFPSWSSASTSSTRRVTIVRYLSHGPLP